jgi:hypothetical protein
MKRLISYSMALSFILGTACLNPLGANENRNSKKWISWNVSSLKEVFSPQPVRGFSSCFCVWQTAEGKTWPLLLLANANDPKQSLFDPEAACEVESLEYGAMIQLFHLNLKEKQVVVGLSKEGKDLIWMDPQRQEPAKRLHIPVYYPLKRIDFYQRQSDGKLFLFGINALGTVLTQLEIDMAKDQMTPLKAFDLQEDFFEKAIDLVCDDEFGRVYVVGERGRLACWDADPESSTKPVLFLQNPSAYEGQKEVKSYAMASQRWMLIKTQAKPGPKPGVGSIGLIEKPGMKVMLWARGLDEAKPARILTLVGCKELVSIDTSFEHGIIGLDLEGRLCLFDDHDFSLIK